VQYAGELLAAFIARAGGNVNGKISTGPVPAGHSPSKTGVNAHNPSKTGVNALVVPVYVHRQSRPLAVILAEMLRGSNNYVANQVFLEIGGHRRGGPVSLEKSVEVARDILAAHDLTGAIQLEEGSGISRGNRFTARGLAKVLNLFAPHTALLVSGKGAAYKTGTLDGVRTLAGYTSTSSHGQVRFVISLKSNNGALRFHLLRAIEAAL
jgi:D-alanyl-D-alanine carboxypeptidase/D-alanyl-D-alanine-endopeptidase (penicillin-binding protein 4)